LFFRGRRRVCVAGLFFVASPAPVRPLTVTRGARRPGGPRRCPVPEQVAFALLSLTPGPANVPES